VLLGRSASVPRRLFNVAAATLGIFAVGMALGYGVSVTLGLGWPPRPSSRFGVWLGIALGLIVFFEMLLTPRKWLRGTRLFGKARLWVVVHVWLGLISLPIVVLHSGFAFGGPLSAWTFALFLGVIASGVYGLCLQQWLPEKIIAEVPNETVASQVDFAIKKHVLEAERIVLELTDLPAEYDDLISGGASARVVAGRAAVIGAAGRLRPVVVGPAADLLKQFHDRDLKRYLERGKKSRSPLATRAESQRLFARLKSGLPDAAQDGVRQLESLADLRRQWDAHRRLNWWLHHWLLIHLPLSVAMTTLMVVHAILAMKYW
jgi:hypothetical protein